MKYCPNCATALDIDEIGGRERPHCRSCNFVDFGSYGLGVGGVVVQFDNDNRPRVLLIQRNQSPNKGG